MLVRLIAFLLIAETACATGLWLNGQEQIASSASVVTNSTTNATQHITNSTFQTGIGGWDFVSCASGGSNTWYSNGTTRAMRMIGNLENTLRIRFQSFSPAITSTNPLASGDVVATVQYWFTNTEAASLVLKDTGFVTEVSNVELPNAGIGVTSTVSVGLNMEAISPLAGIGAELAVSTNGDCSLFFQSITITSVVASSSITTNSGSGVSGPTFDGIVPLSTNRHLWIDGRPSS